MTRDRTLFAHCLGCIRKQFCHFHNSQWHLNISKTFSTGTKYTIQSVKQSDNYYLDIDFDDVELTEKTHGR